MDNHSIPIKVNPAVTGPGSQPADSDGSVMEFMDMPSGMTTYSQPIIPEPEDIVGLDKAIEISENLLKIIQNYKVEASTQIIELNYLDAKNKDFFDQLLGEGEVSVQYNSEQTVLIQESVLAGVWRVQYVDREKRVIKDTIEVGRIPSIVNISTFENAQKELVIEAEKIPESVYNAPPLLVEIRDNLPEYKKGGEAHVINLSLLPHTEEDLMYLSDNLGIGPIIILSRGYGNCRISSASTNNVWWVQYFNSQDTLILNTIEISDVPDVACASQEDIDDSAERLVEILSIYQ